MIHQTDMIIGIGIPGSVDLERAGGLTAIGVAQIREDTAVLSLEFPYRVKGPAAVQAGDRRVQSPARDEQEREARTGLLILNANGAFFIERHGSFSFSSLLTRHSSRCGHHRCGGPPFSVTLRLIGSTIRVLLTFTCLTLCRGAAKQNPFIQRSSPWIGLLNHLFLSGEIPPARRACQA